MGLGEIAAAPNCFTLVIKTNKITIVISNFSECQRFFLFQKTKKILQRSKVSCQ